VSDDPDWLTPDPVIKGMLLKMEQAIHRGGWDQPPRFGYLTRSPHALKFIPMPLNMRGEPGAAIEAAGMDMFHGGAVGGLLAKVTALVTGFYGWAFCFEAWATDTPSAHRERAAADTPGSKEMRGLAVVDIEGRLHELTRIRGEKPRVTLQPFNKYGGRAVNGLIMMLKAVVAHLPDDYPFLERETVDAMRVMTDEQITREWEAARDGQP